MLASLLLLAACGSSPVSTVPAPVVRQAPAIANAAPFEPLLVDMAIHSAWTIHPRDLGEEREGAPRVFVILSREVDRSQVVPGGEALRFEGWRTEYLVHPSPRDVSREEVTLVAPGAACVARPLRLVVLERSDPHEAPAMREAIEVEGCGFAPTHLASAPALAIGGRHPEAIRDDFHRDWGAAESAAELRHRGIVETGERAAPRLRALRTESHDEIDVVSTTRPADDVWSGEEHSNDSDQGHTAYVMHDHHVVAIVPFYMGESWLSAGGRRFLVLQSPLMNIIEYRVYEWTGSALLPVLQSCPERPFDYLDDACHRPF